LLLYDPKTVTSHPQEKTLLTFGADVDTRVEKSPQQPSIAQKHAQQFVVVDIDIMKPRRVEKIVTVDKNCDPSAMTELPGNIIGRIEIMHKWTPECSYVFEPRMRFCTAMVK